VTGFFLTSAARGSSLLPLAASLVLAGCGGGSSLADLPAPPVPACTATDGGGTGFALGVCTDAAVAAFQPVEAAVWPTDAPSYSLTLAFPAALPDGLSASVELSAANRTPVGTRDILGELRGAAYAVDADASAATLTAPYTALTDFGLAWRHDASPGTDPTIVPPLEFSSFGVWERFATTRFTDGYFGGWYAPRPGADALDVRPTLERDYQGVAVGVLSPAEPGGVYSQSYGFSATVVLRAGRAGIVSGTISALKISYGVEPNLTVEAAQVKDLAFSGTDNFADQPVSGSLVSSTGVGADAGGLVEARFFGATGAAPAGQGAEIAGRFRFQTADGKLLGVGAFGVRAAP